VRPELNAKHKIEALQRRKILIDKLISFIRTHPNISSEATLRPLRNRSGLYFYDTAIIRPLWVKGRPVLRLEKYIEEWGERDEKEYSDYYGTGFDTSRRTVCEDASKMSESKLAKMIDKLYEELHPDDDEE
jgi:hypothetical protein